MITIINYGLGNVNAFVSAYKKLNIPVNVATNIDELTDATKLILPGVGSFDYAMERFNNSGMRKKVEQLVLDNSIPIMGVCVGMQILASCSEEGTSEGLGWIPGKVRAVDTMIGNQNLPIPHMGWNNIIPEVSHPLLESLNCDSYFYFLHSYYFECDDQDNILATTSYSHDFSCAIHKGNILGVQFHPEKSHHSGIQILKNFSEI